MLYLITKLLLAPTGLISIFITASLILYRQPRWSFGALGLAALVLFVTGNLWVAGKLVQSLEWKHLPPEELPEADAIVVLSGKFHPKEYPRKTVEIGGNGDRLLYGGYLHKQGKAPLILVTGAGRPVSDQPNTSVSEDMATLLEMVGIAPDVIEIENQARNTFEHGIYCDPIFKRREIRSILLVTSAMHMPRALGVFQQLDITVTPAPTDFYYTVSPNPGPWYSKIWHFVPSWKGLAATTDALHEYQGLLYYRFRGWL